MLGMSLGPPETVEVVARRRSSSHPGAKNGHPVRIPIHHREGELVVLEVCGLDHGRPFFDFRLVVRGKRLRRLVRRGHDFLSDLGNSLLHSRIAQGIEPAELSLLLT